MALAALAVTAAAVLALRRPDPDAAPEGVMTGDGFETMTRDELYEVARERGIPGRSRMKKAELRDALRRT